MGTIVMEITDFCLEKNTFGALLLTGEWGCGKTYLLEHDLPEVLGDRAVILRVSLFGETSVEAVRTKIKKAYVAALLSYIHQMGPEDSPVGESNGWITKTGELTAVEQIFVRNPHEYVRLEPEIGDRRVILIFDDLERCHLSQAEILGCINEYTENLHLKTIIVANEEKIRKNSSKNVEDGRKDYLAYSEIKEKIIACTVKLSADYRTIITNILQSYHTEIPGYKDFLQAAREQLILLVEDCEIRNIRSLRCGLRDFEKIYALCCAERIEESEIRKYFLSFVLFVMLTKGGQITKSPAFGYGLNRLAQKYPGHYKERYMPNCLKDWVVLGTWPGEELTEEIRKNARLARKTTEPEHRLRSLSLMEMDDATVAAGWEAFLELAYAGELSADEYVNLIRNRILARDYGYSWPVAVDDERLAAGVDRLFEEICNSEREFKNLRDRLEESSWKKCTEAENAIYGRILNFFDTRAYLYGINRNRLLTALASGDEQEIIKCRNYEIRSFDEELAEAAAACYRSLENNQKRLSFIDSIDKILRSCKSLEGLASLEEAITTLRGEEEGLPLRAVTTDHFLARLSERRGSL